MTNQLSAWNDGAARSAIVDLVARVTKEGGPDFVPPAERIATFDNDGTLWCEQPIQVQFFFGQARLKERAEKDPSLKDRQPFKAYLEHDLKTMHDLGKKGLFELGASVHAGMTEEDFDRYARAWLASTPHPTLNPPVTSRHGGPGEQAADLFQTPAATGPAVHCWDQKPK